MRLVNVPFAFVVNGQVLPAGEYRVERDRENASVVRIRGDYHNPARVLVVTTPVQGEHPGGEVAVLVFTPSATGYQLVRVWESPETGHEIPSSGGRAPNTGQMIVFGQRAS